PVGLEDFFDVIYGELGELELMVRCIYYNFLLAVSARVIERQCRKGIIDDLHIPIGAAGCLPDGGFRIMAERTGGVGHLVGFGIMRKAVGPEVPLGGDNNVAIEKVVLSKLRAGNLWLFGVCWLCHDVVQSFLHTSVTTLRLAF